MNEQLGASEEIPAIPINPANFTNLKVIENNFEENLCENLTNSSTTSTSAAAAQVIDEEITFTRKEQPEQLEEISLRLQRKSDEEIFNTPKRERNQDEKLNIRSVRRFETTEIPNGEEISNKFDEVILPRTPQKQQQNELVKSLSMEFEQRLASIHVSPNTNNNTNVNTNNTSNNSPNLKRASPSVPRSMSPIRSIAQLSPVSKLNLNEDEPSKPADEFVIETPKLISPSKIASTSVSVAPVASVDVEKIKNELDAKWSKQVEFLQFEVSTLQEKYEESMKNNSEMRTMLAEYEKTLAQFIDARRTRPDQHSSIDQLLQDKKKLELEMQTIQISYQNLHQRYEDLKGLQEQSRINDVTLRQSIQLLQQELASTVRSLENTRRAYEDKIEKINTESKNTKETLEFELSATKAKLLKSELKISSLESAIETKTRENSELMTICDELIHKMDKRCN